MLVKKIQSMAGRIILSTKLIYGLSHYIFIIFTQPHYFQYFVFLNYSNGEVTFSKDDVKGADSDDCMQNITKDCILFEEKTDTLLRMRGLINETGRR